MFARWQHINSDNACLEPPHSIWPVVEEGHSAGQQYAHSLQLPSCHILYALYSIRLS